MVRLDGGSMQKKRHKRSVSLRRYPLWARSQSVLRVVTESGYKTQVPSVSSPLVMAAILGRSSICKRPTILMSSGLESMLRLPSHRASPCPKHHDVGLMRDEKGVLPLRATAPASYEMPPLAGYFRGVTRRDRPSVWSVVFPSL
jgi:hypothetical protein